MLRGFYTATAGMTSQMAAIDLLSNNIANTNAIGYKEDFEALVRASANGLSYGMGGLVRGTGLLSVQQSLDLTQGSLIQTGRSFDLALEGPGMFAVQTANGTAYSRNGRFHITAANQLANDNGQLVLNTAGQPLRLPDSQGKSFTIRGDGTVFLENTTYGQIGVFNAPGWQKTGSALFAPLGGTTTAQTTTPIRQGMVENANIDLVSTMGTILARERSYEAATQLQHTEDQILQQSVNDLARVP